MVAGGAAGAGGGEPPGGGDGGKPPHDGLPPDAPDEEEEEEEGTWNLRTGAQPEITPPRFNAKDFDFFERVLFQECLLYRQCFFIFLFFARASFSLRMVYAGVAERVGCGDT